MTVSAGSTPYIAPCKSTGLIPCHPNLRGSRAKIIPLFWILMKLPSSCEMDGQGFFLGRESSLMGIQDIYSEALASEDSDKGGFTVTQEC